MGVFHGRFRLMGLASIVVVGIAVGLVATSLSSVSARQIRTARKSSKHGTYALGEMDDLTAGFTSVDIYWHDGVVAAVKARNAAGGIDGHKITLYSRDSMGSAPVSVSAFKQLANQDHVSAILGLGDSLVDAAIYPLATSAHIPLTAIGPPINDMGPGSVFFGYGPQAVEEARAQVAYVKQLVATKQLKVGKISTIEYDDPQGVGFAHDVKLDAAKAGLRYVANIEIAPTTTDFSTVAAKFKASGATVILTEAVGGNVTPMMQALSSVGVPETTPIIGYSWSAATSLPWKNFTAVTDYRSTGTSAAVKAYASAAKSAGYNPKHPFIVEGYADAQLVFDALKKCGYPCSSTQLMGELEKTDTNLNGLAFGPVVWTRNFHIGPTELAVAKYSKSGVPTKYYAPVKLYTTSGKPTGS